MGSMREDAKTIIQRTITDVLPDRAVREALKDMRLSGRVYVVAVGKAAWVMAQAAAGHLAHRLEKGIILTKYGHSRGELEGFEIIEAGHPTPDDNSVRGARAAIRLAGEASPGDTVLLLLSGGGSSLMELPADGLSLEDIREVTRQLLHCGAGITEINVLRKRLSAVKGGKFARHLGHARAFSVILSDIVGGGGEMVASGLTYPDGSTAEEARRIVETYGLRLDGRVERALYSDPPSLEAGVENHVVGSVGELCRAAAAHAGELGYTPHILTSTLQCEAREAGRWIASLAGPGYRKPYALIAGGETVVKVTGEGMGGRNQELALAAAEVLSGREDVLLFSLGSDGTDGPTDAAGGMVDGRTARLLRQKGIDIGEVLRNNDSYHALAAVDGLIMTGATGTNVNDVTVLLCR